MNCKHTDVLVTPGSIIPDGDGFVIGNLMQGSMFCRECQDELPIEDLQFYHKDHISIAIPTDLVDPPTVSEPAP